MGELPHITFQQPGPITTKIDFPQLMDLLDLVTMLHPELGPIIIFSEVQSLSNLGTGGEELLKTIVTTSERRMSGEASFWLCLRPMMHCGHLTSSLHLLYVTHGHLTASWSVALLKKLAIMYCLRRSYYHRTITGKYGMRLVGTLDHAKLYLPPFNAQYLWKYTAPFLFRVYVEFDFYRYTIASFMPQLALLSAWSWVRFVRCFTRS